MNWLDNLTDDKALVIFAVTALGIVSLFAVENATSVVNQITSGLFGVAVGKALK